MADEVSSFWGPVTSTHEWCEPNYAYSSYIAEFFNTVSNVPCMILAFIGLANALRQRFGKRFSVLHISNVILAIGSILYHSSLQRLQQQGDETPMVWEMLLYIYILYSPDWHYRSTMPTFLFLYGAAFAVAHALLHFDIAFKLHYALLCLLCIPRMYKYYIHTEDRSAKRLAKLYATTLSEVFAGLLMTYSAKKSLDGTLILRVMRWGLTHTLRIHSSCTVELSNEDGIRK